MGSGRTLRKPRSRWVGAGRIVHKRRFLHGGCDMGSKQGLEDKRPAQWRDMGIMYEFCGQLFAWWCDTDLTCELGERDAGGPTFHAVLWTLSGMVEQVPGLKVRWLSELSLSSATDSISFWNRPTFGIALLVELGDVRVLRFQQVNPQDT